MFFELGRHEGFPTQYAPNPTAVTVDVLEAGLITVFLILLIAFLISSSSSIRKANINLLIRVVITLAIGLFILLGNFGQDWEVGHIQTKTPYRAGLAQEINASIGVKIGLRSVNVTLHSDNNGGKLHGETINYNERFSWTWDQGRFGFGPYAGRLQQEFRAAQYRGLPLPILWVMDYFVIDGEGFRFGRFYRTAGWYSHIALWAAFAAWLLCVPLFMCVINYGAVALAISGVLQLTANLIWSVVRNPLPLVIPFENATITTKFGFSYWLVFASGALCLIISIVIIIMDKFYDVQLYTFFGVDTLNIYEVAYLTQEERLQLRNKNRNDIPLMDMQSQQADEQVDYVPVYLRKNMYKPPPPPVIRSNKPKIALNMPSTSHA